MNHSEAVADFLTQQRIAVAGLSRRNHHVSHAVFQKLAAANRQVFPVNPAAGDIDGHRCYPDLKSIPGGVTAVMIVTRPQAAAAVVRDCIALGIPRVWLHRSLGAGRVAEEAVRIARAAGITVIPGGCPMMYCQPVDPAHRCARWCLELFHRLPANVGS